MPKSKKAWKRGRTRKQRRNDWDRVVNGYEFYGPEQVKDEPDYAADPLAFAEDFGQEHDSGRTITYGTSPWEVPNKYESEPRIPHQKIVFPDDLPAGEIPAEYIWPERPGEQRENANLRKRTSRSKPKASKRVKRAPKEPKQPKPKRYLEPGLHLYNDPMTSPSRIMNEWSDDTLSAVWRFSRDHGQITGMPGAFQLQLRRNKAPKTEPREMSAEDHACCFRIVKHTSYDAYKASSIGWHVTSKKAEISSDNMTYILVRDQNGNDNAFAAAGIRTDIVAFISFRIERDDEPFQHRQVLYIYEVHIAEKFRGKGLGRWLVFTVEAMAQSIYIGKTMLTVFTSNAGAIKAYQKMGYTEDQATPPARKVRGRTIRSDYLIMGKSWSLQNGEVRSG